MSAVGTIPVSLFRPASWGDPRKRLHLGFCRPDESPVESKKRHPRSRARSTERHRLRRRGDPPPVGGIHYLARVSRSNEVPHAKLMKRRRAMAGTKAHARVDKLLLMSRPRRPFLPGGEWNASRDHMSDFTTPVLHLLFAARRGALTRITGVPRSAVQSSSEEVAEFFLIMPRIPDAVILHIDEAKLQFFSDVLSNIHF